MNNDEIKKINQFFDALINNNVQMETVPPHLRTAYIDPDDDYDFHAYRILLLLRICGTKRDGFFSNPTIYGRRKFSFFDFLIRYPFYLMKAIDKSNKKYLASYINLNDYEKKMAFSPMIRYIRGPWDHRYDSIFNYMISKKLIDVKYDYFSKSQKAFLISLTPLGAEKADEIVEVEKEWKMRMETINKIFPSNATNDYIEKYVQKEFPSLILGYYGVSDSVY
ncbi:MULTISPECIES: hypothetical protein [Brevibacillus]|uniref:hypothetical protein n=1 Tax=Brevibacillus TaxID=55080 RepID=UPI000D10A1F7|nr:MULTISPECIES: hypothetical protein [Brevibacillus]MED1948705.1 hypothetical protein [Brevibacillus formosus]MED2000404.1 hypothetical protein [Brevibacillus formosus]MED2085574.1 hypothetical protein [Brevibacillus formosus]PSK16310.1 hypothetical protein C7R94_17470 [Brevibacillus sp. NRRL NRS-603]